jgi:hypothetical protein
MDFCSLDAFAVCNLQGHLKAIWGGSLEQLS